MGRSLHRAGLALLALLAGWSGARADTPLEIGCTATTDCASAALGIEDGIFARHGIDAKLTLIGLNSNIPAALVSGSLQIGGPTPSVFLQAVDGGLDLVGVAGATSTSPGTADVTAAVVRSGETVKGAQDFAGKKVGVPGIGALLDVLFRRWLIQHGVDPKSVSFVEVTFPTMNDVLKSGAVDAVVTSEPVLSRIVKAGTGTVAANFMADVPAREPQILYAATRSWADANPKLVADFRAAVVEAAADVIANPDKARAALSRFTKVPMDLMKTLKLAVSDPVLTASSLDWWVETMKRQDMLQGSPDVNALIVP